MNAETMAQMSSVTTWNKRVPILTDYYTGRDFCLWILTSGAAFTLLLLIFSGFRDALDIIRMRAIMTGIIFILFTFVAGLILRNHFTYTYTLNTYGAKQEVDQRIKNINNLTAAGGAIAGSMSTLVSSYIAMSQEEMSVRWADLKHVIVDEKRHIVILRNSWRVLMRLNCYPENFEAVVQHVKANVRDDILIHK
jgi:hypothetical protein